MKRMRFDISGMNCDACVRAIDSALQSLGGVQDRNVGLNFAEVTVDESQCSTADVVSAIRGAGGFDVTGFRAIKE